MSTATSDFSPGDWIVHRHHGVGRIEALESKQLGGKENSYYRIKTFESTIWIPVARINNGQVRALAGETELSKAIKVLNRPPKELPGNLNVRKTTINQAITNNKPADSARLIRDLRARRSEKSGLNQHERQALNHVSKHFLQEWAVCKGIENLQDIHSLIFNLGNKQTGSSRRADEGRQAKEREDVLPLLDTLAKTDEKWVDWIARQLAVEK